MRIEHDFPLDAEYHFSVRGNLPACSRTHGTPRWTSPSTASALQVENPRDFRLRVTRRASRADRDTFRDPPFHWRQRHLFGVQVGRRARARWRSPGRSTQPAVGDTASRRRIFSCRPQSKAEERACAEKILVNIASRAFARRKRSGDLADILRFYERGQADGGFEAGIQQALSRVLIDPRFLFRFEAEPR